MILDDKGQSKGFAFVEFHSESDARAALAANNHELKRRRMAVTLADSRARGKNRYVTRPMNTYTAAHTRNRAPGYHAEVRNRSVRVRNLPPNAQEGLLQQALEKHAQVKRVEVFQDSNEADVELENAAVRACLFCMQLRCRAEIALPSGSRQTAAPARFDRLRWKQAADRCGEHHWTFHRPPAGTTCGQRWPLRASCCRVSTARWAGKQATRLGDGASTRLCGGIEFGCISASSYEWRGE